LEWWLVRRRVGVGRRQWNIGQIARAGVAGLGLIALLSPILRLPTKDVATVFAIDASDSLGPGGRRDAVTFVENALFKMPKSSRAGVIVFGGTAQVTAAVQRQLKIGDVSTVIDASNTDLAGALRLAGAASPTDAARRIVLVSDGRRTVGDEAAAAQELAAANIRLDVAIAGRPGTSDVAVDSFRVPPKAQQGERLVLQANLRATEPMTTEVILKADGVEISRETIALQSGDNPWRVELSAASSGVATYSLEVVSQQDTVVQNDVGYAATAIDGATRVLVLRGDSASYAKGGNGADEIAAALTSSGLEVVTKRASELDGLEDLAGVSAVVLVDVHRRELNNAQVDVLTGAVRELGVGMTVIGGTNSFGSGGYLGSRLEALLPVVSEVADPKRRTPVAQAIVIDTSGSMSAPVDGNRTALDLAKAGALGAVGALSEGDKVGVVGVDDDRQWVMNVQDLPSYDTAKKEISKLDVGGGTVIEGSLTEAAKQLDKSGASVKHILVLSDGYTSDPQALIDEATKLRAQGITVSVVGAGTDIEPNFGKVAVAGGGRFVPGGDFANLPAVFIEETQTVARNLVNEGDFVPEITSSSAAVRDLQTAPGLKGFQATTPRPTARTSLRVGPYKDPLLTSWQAGLGKVSTWTSDGGQRWAPGWSALDQPFWSSVVKDTILSGGAGTVRASVEDGRLKVRAVGPSWGTDATAIATVRSPNGDPIQVPLRRTSEGAYVGEVDAPNAGTYAVGVTVKGGSGAATGGAVFKGGATAIRGYSAEYEPGTIERERLVKLSQRTKGRGVITAAQVFDGSGLVAGKRLVNLAPWLLSAAALLWVLSIALWRVPFGKPAFAVPAPADLRPQRTQSVASPEPPEPPKPTAPSAPPAPKSDLQELLKAARERRGD
jgi:Mg-chelatase subunit ChlD